MEPSTRQGKEVSRDTLRILNLPSYLSHLRREMLLKKYGAVGVKTVNKSEKRAITFAKFPSERAAARTFLRLHQLAVRGRRLSVEFAKNNARNSPKDERYRPESPKNDGAKEEPAETNFQMFLKKLNGWAFSQVFTQPPPPGIRYNYSPPTANTLSRIAVQMIREPAFYRQVLHLMNKMNLPPPFQELEIEFPFLKDVYDAEGYRDIFEATVVSRKENGERSDESVESELETTDDETVSRPKEIIPVKRKLARSSKRLKIPKFVNPSKQARGIVSTGQKSVKPEDVFEPMHRGESKSLKITLKADLDSERQLDAGADAGSSTANSGTPAPQEEGGFGLIYPVKKLDDDGATNGQTTGRVSPEFVTPQCLAANRISINNQRLLPVFKNYHPGKPSCRLYIKNLSKHVETKDLDFIYKRYTLSAPEGKDSASRYNVRLMQEGRMKGQAFVTLDSVRQAEAALEETNGYMFKDKPMVVQFARIAGKPPTP